MSAEPSLLAGRSGYVDIDSVLPVGWGSRPPLLDYVLTWVGGAARRQHAPREDSR